MISELTPILTPPRGPVLVPDAAEFELLERQLGVELPPDYRDYWTTFGAGAISEFVGVLRPQARAPHLDYVTYVVDSLQHDVPAGSNWEPHPARGGLIPWGSTDNGDILAWRTVGSPESWTVAVLPNEAESVDDYAASMTSFLAQWISGKLVVRSFPGDIVHGFVPRRVNR